MVSPKDDLDAVRNICEMLNAFSTEEKIRILKWSIEKLNIKATDDLLGTYLNPGSVLNTSVQKIASMDSGIHESATKWLLRSNLSEDVLEEVFSIGLDEFDVVAKKIPGSSKKERMKNIFILTGVASYLKTGIAKFTHEKVKETCTHYASWDTDNFHRHLKTFIGELKGDKSSGYTLTSKGLSLGSELIKIIASERS